MKDNKNENKNLKKELYIKILILIILILLLVITSFNTGRKFYLLKHTYLENSKGTVNSDVARWNFSARIIMGNEVEENENSY